MTTSKKDTDLQPPPLSEDGRRRGRRDGRGAGIVNAQRPDQHALAEHLAGEGHFPRIRPRLRQEGQRHDRRRPQDRGAARRRGGAGLRPARRGLQGHARRRPWRARLSLRQAERAGAVGLGSRLCDGRQHAAGLAQVWRRQGAAREALRLDRRQRRLVPVWADADPAARLVQEADHQGRRHQGPQVPHRRHLDRRVHRHGRRGQRAARRRNRRRRWTAACSMPPNSTTPRPTAFSASPTFPRSACCRATTRTPSSSRSCSTRTSTTRCRRR